MLTAAPPRSAWRVLEKDSLREQFVTNAIRFAEVARSAGGVTRIDQLLHAGIECVVALRKNVEDRIDPHQRGLQSFGVAGSDPAGVDRDVRVANQDEERAERAGGIEIVIHRRFEIDQEL